MGMVAKTNFGKERQAEETAEADTGLLRGLALLAVAPLIGLAYLVLMPLIGFALFFVVLGMGLAKKLCGQRAEDIG